MLSGLQIAPALLQADRKKFAEEEEFGKEVQVCPLIRYTAFMRTILQDCAYRWLRSGL